MWNFSPTTRIAFSLACLTVTAVLSATLLGILPDHRVATVAARTRQVETIAVHFSALAQQVDANQMGKILVDLISRNPELQSVGIRRTGGHYLIEAGEHRKQWGADPSRGDPETQIQFPIYHDAVLWGTVEARFLPVTAAWFPGFAPGRKLLSALYVGGLSLLMFLVFLRGTLAQVSPTGVVPPRVSQALDALTEGLLILDENGQIVLANAAFAEAVAAAREDLIGQPISRFPWQPRSHEKLPWELTQSGDTIQQNVVLSSGADNRIYEISAVPIRDEAGVVRGSMVSFEDVTACENQICDRLRFEDEVSVSAEGEIESREWPGTEQIDLPRRSVGANVSVAAAEAVMHDLNELAKCLSEQDFDRIAAITEHMKDSATRMGADRLKAKAQNLQSAVLSDSDMLDILQMARELTEECRDLQVQ